MTEVIMPKMGDAMEEGTLVEWLKGEGATVKSGEVLGNIQTDKAVVELTAPASGVLSGLLIQAGETVPVGNAIAAILKDGESLPDGWGGSARVPEPAKAAAAAESPRAEAKSTATQVVERPPQPAPVSTGRIVASPLAKRLAKELGVSLEGIRGTGPNGRIVERDVRMAAPGPGPAVAATPSPVRGELRDLTFLQKITAERTAVSKQTIPHYYVTVEADLEALEAIRQQMKADDPELKISLNDFFLKACAMALVDQPHINASFENGKLKIADSVNIGVAAAVPDGLTMPVVKNCEGKTLRQIAAEVRELVARARENRLKPDELSGSTFAVSNMGMFDVENFAAIINQPNGAIIAVSSARRVPAVVEDENGEEVLEIRTRMKFTGSFDHRIIDGALGAQFLSAVKAYLEAPTRLLA
ncbi:2-oxo acid dehydrogenase subunit E2 [Fimbriimonadia bacterium ATM]|nr:MAG: 2-oxo acid dehydrogenase subunit E2 [Armatimonadota bacterium]MBC6968771.1 2-oxo acid dehydrogenase subunit E2 [Armatimonadota bacterium]MCE7899900.1 2-oxo acid dehydrogenase subunit E2 [Armatimonadetes bacterium ATM1]MDL1928647.1 2-oxo acid dehydrogenase subunit E2 [Fimbriimonadia bacterium ATM]RIJ96928.1 MAG: pyruvate dehydrogenase complex dihydrolipoamide acetyltransferase [Armatimonadota bacterium]